MISVYHFIKQKNKLKMVYGILACCVEENYLHNVRRAINDLKKNVSEIRTKTMIKVKTLLQNNRKLMNKTILEEIKTSLSATKLTIPKRWGMYYIQVDMNTDYYLYHLINNSIEGNGSDNMWSNENNTWVNTKKLIMDEIKNIITSATTEELYECFEDGLDKYGKFKWLRKYVYSNNELFTARLELYDCWETNNEVVKTNTKKMEKLIGV